MGEAPDATGEVNQEKGAGFKGVSLFNKQLRKFNNGFLRSQARRQLNWNGGGGGMDSQYKLLSELLSDQAAFITSPKTSLANYWGGGHCPPAASVYGPVRSKEVINAYTFKIPIFTQAHHL